AKIMKVFSQLGTRTNYGLGSGLTGGLTSRNPTYAALMEAADSNVSPKSYLGTEESYRFIRDMEMRGKIIPVFGDFGGRKSLRAIGPSVRDHDARINYFYTSNVEPFLFPRPAVDPAHIVNGGWSNYMASVETLPIDETSVFLRYPLLPQANGQIELI